ncbi:MAG: carbohydrate porin [bacterium]|nr:carbohydrate porin [bacterium]
MDLRQRSFFALVAYWATALTLALCSPARAQASAPAAAPPPDATAQASQAAKEGTTSQPAEPMPSDRPFSLATTPRLTGDWGGLRTDLEDQAGISFKIKVLNQIMFNAHGGLETKNGHDFGGSYEFDLLFDLERLKLVPGATFWIRAKGTWGGDDSDFDEEKIGGLFKTNQDARSEEPIFVAKWHWQQFLAGRRIEFRLGRQEPVKDLFDTSKVMGHEDKYFLNRALVRNATIPPDKGLGAFLRIELTDELYLSAAALDAQSRGRRTNFDTAFHDEDHFRFYAEIGWDPAFETPRGKHPGHYRVGTWYDPTRKEVFFNNPDGDRPARHESGDWGLFTGLDQMIWKENAATKDTQGLSLAARYGCAHGDVNRIEHFWAVAMQYRGAIPGRDRDLLGFGMAQAILSEEYRSAHRRADRETVYELYYAIEVAPWLIISPDFQFVTNTGGDKNDPNTFVAGLRFKMSL